MVGEEGSPDSQGLVAEPQLRVRLGRGSLPAQAVSAQRRSRATVPGMKCSWQREVRTSKWESD